MWTAPEMIAALKDPPKNRHELIYHGTVRGDAGRDRVDHPPDARQPQLRRPLRRGGPRASPTLVWGREMLAHLEQVCVERGRTRLDAITDWPYDGPPDGAGAPGVEFGRAHGYAFGLGDVQRELPLPADDAVLAALAAEAAPHHAGYELRSWAGPIPDDIVQSYLELSTTLATEAPIGDLEREDEAVDIEAHRSAERVLGEQQRVPWHTVALDGDGRVVAYSDLVVPGTDPRWIYQWGTLVARAHRGHRLGVAVKVANLRAFQAAHPEERRRIITWNAEVNDHMIAVNERMGFSATARGGQLQKKM